MSARGVRAWLAVALCHLPVAASAQQTAVSLETLLPPSAPAFTLLGIEPSAVQRPETPKAVTATLLSLFGDKDAIPKNAAIEVTPYWLHSRPAFAFDDFYQQRGQSTLGTIATAIARSGAFSLATTPRVAGTDTTGTSLAIGARALLWPGRPSKVLRALRAHAAQTLANCALKETPAEIDACVKPFTDSVRSHLEPEGFVLQLSTGASAAFPSDVAEQGRFRRAGVWLSPSYRLPNQVELIMVGRWLHEQVQSSDTANANLFDIGGRLRWTPSPVLALSAELLGRHGSGGSAPSQSTSRYGALVEVRASDDLYVFYSVGKDFQAAEAPQSKLVSSIGVSVGFGPKPLVQVGPQ